MKPFEVFFRALYKDQTGVLELRTFGPEKHNETPEAERQRKAAYRLRDFLLVEDGNFDSHRVERFLTGCAEARLGAFFGVALRAKEALTTKKGDTANCQTLTALFVDADYKHLGEQETRRRISSFPLPPSLLVCSGGGLHPYWHLETPIYLQAKGGMVRAKLSLKNLARSVADVVDESVSEPIRVLRIPGSYNFKREYGEPREVILEIGPETNVNPVRAVYSENRATEIMLDSAKFVQDEAPLPTDDEIETYEGEVPGE